MTSIHRPIEGPACRNRSTSGSRSRLARSLVEALLSALVTLCLLTACSTEPHRPSVLSWPWSSSPHAAAALPVQRLPDGWQRGPFLQIFVRAWRDSNGDGIGDLRGLTQTLDYVQALGIKGLWLMPITPNSDRDHGYASTAYTGIEPAYGTLADFDELVREAARRGIGIIIDYVLNHASAEHPAFVSARSDPNSRTRNWFIWADTKPEGWFIWDKEPWYWAPSQPWWFNGPPRNLPKPPEGARDFFFGTFGPHMPDFNLRNPEVVQYHADALAWWLARGLGGFRLDATPHLIENDAANWNDQPESRALTQRLIRPLLDKGDRYVVCEATTKPEEWARPDVCNGAFAFGLNYELMQAVNGSVEAVGKVAQRYATLPPTMATFLHNHDRFAGERVADQVAGEVAAMRVAAASYLLGPGTPFIYYGEEIGMAGTLCADGTRDCGDRPLRGPMSWTADPRTAGFTSGQPFRAPAANVATANVEQGLAEPNSLLETYRGLIRLRNQRPSLNQGRVLRSVAQGSVLLLEREAGGERTLVAINFGAQPGAWSLEPGPLGGQLVPVGGSATVVAPSPNVAPPTQATPAGGGAWQGQLAPRAWAVWGVEPSRLR